MHETSDSPSNSVPASEPAAPTRPASSKSGKASPSASGAPPSATKSCTPNSATTESPAHAGTNRSTNDLRAARRLITVNQLADALLGEPDYPSMAERLWVDDYTFRLRLAYLSDVERAFIAHITEEKTA